MTVEPASIVTPPTTSVARALRGSIQPGGYRRSTSLTNIRRYVRSGRWGTLTGSSPTTLSTSSYTLAAASG